MTASNWERAPIVVAVGFVAAVALTVTVVSYEHEYQLAHHNGQVRWVACLLPFCVDGMVFVATAAIFWAAQHGVRKLRQLVLPILTGLVGMSATIAANIFSDLRFWWLGPAVAGSSGVALVFIALVAHWMLATQKRLDDGDLPQRGGACSCPPSATSLAEAVPLARLALRAAGEPHGQEVLAQRFGVTVHQVRKILAPPVDSPSLNGASHE